jgi:hypothetical protein
MPVDENVAGHAALFDARNVTIPGPANCDQP